MENTTNTSTIVSYSVSGKCNRISIVIKGNLWQTARRTTTNEVT